MNVTDQIVSFSRKFNDKTYAKKNLPVWFWKNGEKDNFGDTLFYELVCKLLGKEIKIATSASESRFIPGGSTLHFLRNGDVAWGIGYNDSFRHKWKVKPEKAAIHSVRGPLTATFVKHTLGLGYPVIAGDPAILTPELFPDYKQKNKSGTGLVCHFLSEKSTAADVKKIDVLRSPKDVIPEIAGCERVISSSLHGIILAEAFGVPAIWLAEKDLGPGHTKFYDYYLSTGRSPDPAYSLSEALLRKKCEPLPDFDTRLLRETFPWELYSEG